MFSSQQNCGSKIARLKLMFIQAVNGFW